MIVRFRAAACARNARSRRALIIALLRASGSLGSTTSPLTWLLPLNVAPFVVQAVVVSDMTKSAAMLVTPAPQNPLQLVKLTSATEASEEVTPPWAMTVAWEEKNNRMSVNNPHSTRACRFYQ